MKRLTILICIFICATLIFGPIKVLYEYTIPVGVKAKQTRIHMNTGNTTRVEGKNMTDIAIEIGDILYPAAGGTYAAPGYLLISSEKWQDILCMMPVVNKYMAPVVNVSKENIASVLAHISTKQPKGISQLAGAKVIYAGNDIDITSAIIKSGIKSYNIAFSDFNQLIEKVYALPGISDKQEDGFLVPDSKPMISIPVGSWIANQGGALLFYDSKYKLTDVSVKIIKNLKLKNLYYLVEDKNSQSIEEAFKENENKPTPVLVGKNEAAAVNFARYYDQEKQIGWNAGFESRDSGHNFILCSKENPGIAAIAAQLSITGKSGPLLWTDGKKLSAATEGFLWSLKPNYWITPAEGPYNNAWIIGNDKMIDYSVQARVDYTEEIDPYETMGERGVSGLDAISIVLVVSAFCSALWIALHVSLRMHYLPATTKLMWILSALVIGPIALIFYIISYYNIPWMKMGGNKIWLRPLWKQSAIATLAVVAFSTSTIEAISFWLTWLGLPNLANFKWGGFFLMGNPMILQMTIVYTAAFLINAFVILPTIMNQTNGTSYSAGISKSIGNVFISLTSYFLGRSISLWWLTKSYVPLVPDESQIIWWGFMFASALVGFATAYIPIWKLVRFGKVMGTM